MSDLSNSGFVPLSQFASVGSLSALGAGGWGPRYPARARWQAPAAESDRGRSAPGPADPVGEGRGAGGSPAAEGLASRRLSEVRCSTGQSRMSRASGSSSMSESPTGSFTGPRSPGTRVSSGIEGLIHVSDIASRHLASLTEVVRPGEVVRVRVVAIDAERRHLSRSIRQASANVMYETRTAN